MIATTGNCGTLTEFFEDVFLFLQRNSNPRIFNAELHEFRVYLPGRDSNSSAFRSELDGVRQQILQDLRDLTSVLIQQRQRL